MADTQRRLETIRATKAEWQATWPWRLERVGFAVTHGEA
jgi:hypothetical protein